MTSPILWYLLAGFVLGFAISTLWEWLYYRGVRQRTSATILAANPLPPPTPQVVDVASPPGQTDYRSPAIFIEGERPAEVLAAAEPIPSYEPLTPRKTAADAAVAPQAPMEEPDDEAIDEEDPAADNEAVQIVDDASEPKVS